MNGTRQVVGDLVERARLGDEQARHDLLAQYRGYLKRMIAIRLDQRLAARVDPSDIVQETLSDAARRLDEFLHDCPLSFFGWLRQIASERLIDTHRRHVLSQCRSVKRESGEIDFPDDSVPALTRSLIANDTSPSNRLSRQEQQDRLRSALAALSERDREVLVMRHLEQLSTAEIADALGVSVGAVESRQLRALIRLRARMEVDS